jgi:hypothetical protein
VPDREPRGGFDPFRKEGDMFRVLLWFVAFMAALVVIVLLIRAL